MTKSEIFALNEWLSDFPDNLTYAEIIASLRDPDNQWCADDISVWELVENYPSDEIADMIESTKQAFERATA